MKRIHWGFLTLGIISTVVFLIFFFQNLNPMFFSSWQFLFSDIINSTAAITILAGFVSGFLTATLFFFSVRGGRYDPTPVVQGKEQPDNWERMADQY